MSSALERVIEESLEGLESGRSIEEILAEHPAQAETLRPILATAAAMASLKIAHSIGAQSSSLDQFLAAASAKRGAAAGSSKPFWIFGRRLAVTASVILLLLLAISSSVTFAAQTAIPGDALYNAKVAIEDFRISLVGEGPSRDRLDAAFNKNRIEEIEELIASGRSASGIEFTGQIESIDGQTWVISGIPITVSDDFVAGTFFDVGQEVFVKVDVKNGEAEAVRLVRTSRSVDDLEPEPVATEQPEDIFEPDLEPSPTLPATATATDLVTETPEATPTLEGDDHENGEDGDNSEDEESEDNSGGGEEEENNEDNSGSGSVSDDGDSDEDHSESSDGEEDEEDEEDRSGSGSGSNDGDSDEDHSGSSNEEDDEEDEEDSSGSGSGSDDGDSDEDHSGSSDDEEDKEKGEG
jgi:hypothetical protein